MQYSADIERVQRQLGLLPDGLAGPRTRAAVKKWQARRLGLTVDGIAGPQTLGAMADEYGWREVLPATRDNIIKHCIEGTIRKETSGRPDVVNRNYEARGVFDKPDDGVFHYASYRHPKNEGVPRMLGGSFFENQAMQASGATGLVVMDIPEEVRRECGLTPEHEAVLTSPDGEWVEVKAHDKPWEREMRNGRVQKVNGEDLWEGENLQIMKRLARHPETRAAARRMMYYQYIKPMLRHARLHTAQEYAVLFDIANANGVTGARRRLPETWSDVRELIDGTFTSAKARKRRYDVVKATTAFVTFES